MRIKLDPPAVPPPPEIEALLPLPCDARQADHRVSEAAGRLARLQARMAVWLLILLALAFTVPALLGAYPGLAIIAFIILLASSAAAAVRVFQAIMWVSFLRRVRAAIWNDPQSLKELCEAGQR